MPAMKTRVPWPLTVFVVVMLPVVISLGNWQLRRADEKQLLETSYLANQGQPAVSLDDTQPFSLVRVQGFFDQPLFLLDNQVRDGQVGYWVLQPFSTREQRRVIVNRGWVAAPPSRASLPQVPTPQETVELVGIIWPQLGMPPLLEDDVWDTGQPVIRVQRRNIDRMAALTDAEAIELRLLQHSPGVLLAAPAQPKFSRQTHLGYAFQWFGLALVLVVGWAAVYWRGVKTGKEGG